jgi:hypothetical protein
MAVSEHPMRALEGYLPPNTFDLVVNYLHQYKVHLTVTRERASVLGDYRNAIHQKNHRISVNGNLNKYGFLITLLHELAHLLTFEKYGHKVKAHGKEWKQLYSLLLADFLKQNIFPFDVSTALKNSLDNPAASSCSEEELMRVLSKYDVKKPGFYLIEQLASGVAFVTKDGRVFKKGEKLRKRYRCVEIKTGIAYLFSPVYEVKLLNE